ncbi:MAG: aminotransferase class I/II-fold pyridoxal phosphate-dependent enzyme [Bacteroidales bacterium]|nr:aminotransferase class I/II-fold pyridoxal phosphate-dependent enzyme [Bacteroidales bacterium]
MNKKIWLSSPHMSGNEIKYINDAFENNWIAPLGPNVDGFEKDLQNYLNIDYAAALSSGTAALHLALILLDVKRDDEVIVSSFTFSASVNPIIYQSAKPIFIDSEKDTWNMDPQLLEDAIKSRINKGKKPKAIIVVHLYGMPAKMDEILNIANKYDIPVIEDAAESLGSKYKGKATGTLSMFGIFSFNGNKIITTSGGGALVSNNKELTEKARFLATQARDEAPHYQHSQIGYNYRMSNIAAGIGRGQMHVLNSRVEKRREINNRYKDALSEREGIEFLNELNADYYSNFWLTTIIIDKEKIGKNKKDILNTLNANNIESRPVWKPMHLQPVFKNYLSFTNGVSESLFNTGLCLPSGSNLEQKDQDKIIKLIID